MKTFLGAATLGLLVAACGGGSSNNKTPTGSTSAGGAGGTGGSSPAVADGVVYVNMNMTIYALDAATGKEKWHTQVDTHPQASGWSSPIVLPDGRVVVGNSSSEEIAGKNSGATFHGGAVVLDKT